MLDVIHSLPTQRPPQAGWRSFLPEDPEIGALVTASIVQAINDEDLVEADITEADIAMYSEVWADHLLDDLRN